ncbi:prenyltransferase/squalene oxidase repeat-containing protein [Actinomadura rubrisoli]|nr:prenyltransferase/squalene oxidase repeat-containing protein [Actinomadura rubrisoli]
MPAELPAARDRLRVRLLERIAPDGTLHEPCHSRVLESALALPLLRRYGSSVAAQRLARYLDHRRRYVEPLDRLLATIVLDDARERDPDLIDRIITEAPQFTGTRKRATLEAIFTACGAPPPRGAPLDPAAFSTTGLHRWAEVQVTAVKVILATATRHRELIGQDDVRLLLATQQRPWVWEADILIHLSVLHALAGMGGMDDVVALGVAKLAEHQRHDGGFPFVTDVDTWCAATAGIALASAGASRQYLMCLAAALAGKQKPGGGWSFTDRAEQTDVDDTSVALEFLHTLNAPAHQAVIARGLDSLISVRGPDGGFPTYIAGTPSEPCMTAAAMNALSIRPKHYGRVRATGLDYLIDRQRDDGTFDPDWSASRLHTLFRVVLAADRSTKARRMADRAVRHVLETQNADGGWGQQTGSPSDAISTAYALIALCHQDDPEPAATGAGYLIEQQQADGGIDSFPDSIGPRPFVFRVPLLADTFSLLAIGHLTTRLEPSALDVDRRAKETVFGD